MPLYLEGQEAQPSVTLWSAVVPFCRTKENYCSRNYWASHLAADKLLLGLSSNSHLSSLLIKCENIHTHLKPTHREAINKRTLRRQNSCWAGGQTPDPHLTVMLRDISCWRLPKQLCEDQAQAMATVTLKTMTPTFLTGPRLYLMVEMNFGDSQIFAVSGIFIYCLLGDR